MPSSAGINAGGPGSDSASLASYLISHNTGETWYVAVPGSNQATSLIIDYGIPVMSLGGFSGTDQILTVEKLRDLVNEGKIRYFLLPSMGQGNGMAQGDSETNSFVRNQSTVIPASEWGGTTLTTPSGNITQSVANRIPGQDSNGPGTGSQNVLYDLGNHHTSGNG
jgi:hypothetical protein